MTDVVRPLKIAVWQAASVAAGTEANIAALDAAAGAAAEQGVELLITPEMFVTGYNIGAHALKRLAADRPLERVREISRRHALAIVAGGPELLGGADTDPALAPVANSAWLIDDTGVVLAKHRKIQLFGDLDRDMFVAGDEPLTIAEYRGHRIAILICFDVEFPETVRAAGHAGADLVAVPTAQMEPYRFVNDHVIRVRAWENSLYVAYANQHGPDGDLEYVGRSVIAGPLGTHLAQADAAGEAMLVATVDRAERAAARAQNPYLAEVRRELFLGDVLP